MKKFSVVAYSEVINRYEFEVEANTKEEAEAFAQAIIETGRADMHYSNSTDEGPIVVEPEMTEEILLDAE